MSSTCQDHALLTVVLLPRAFRFSSGYEDAKNFVLAHDQIVLTIDHDIRAAVFAEEHTISRLNVHWLPFAVRIDLALAGGNHLSLLWFLLRGVGNYDTAGRYLRLLDAFDEHSIVQWLN